MSRVLFSISLCCLCLGKLCAAPLSLDDAVRTALSQNPEVKAALQDVVVARTKLEQVNARERPRVSIDAAYLDLSAAPEVHLPSMSIDLQPILGMPKTVPLSLPALPLSNDNITNGSVNFSVPLYTGGRMKYGREQVESGIAALQARSESKRRDIVYAVQRAYLGAVLAQRVADVADQAYATMRKHEAQAEALLKQGQVPKYEVIRAQAEVANQDKRRLDAHNQADLTLAFLLDVMGTPMIETPTLTTTLNGSGGFTRSLDDAVTAALSASTDMQALQARDRMYAAAEKGARAEMHPTVGAIATKKLFINEQPFTTPDTTVGLLFSIPLYDGGLSKAQAAEQSALRERNQSDMQRLDHGIRLEVRKYYLDLQSARKALDASDKAVELATESLRLATRRFEEGQGTGIEKSDAILALSLAETNREQARYQYDIAYYGLQKVLGDTMPEDTTNAAQ